MSDCVSVDPLGSQTELSTDNNYYFSECSRDPRGFSIKFYTEDGIWDMVGNNTPIFFVRDPLMFISFIHSQKRNPVTNLKVSEDYPQSSPECMNYFHYVQGIKTQNK